MIVRTSLRCEVCDRLHVVRIGMGQEERQTHRFACRECQTEIAVALEVNYKEVWHRVVIEENARHAREERGAAIVNLDANFPMNPAEQGIDFAFPRVRQLHKFLPTDESQIASRSFSVSDLNNRNSRPLRRPDYHSEWQDLRKAWMLHRNGKSLLVRTALRKASAAYYSNEPLQDVSDWAFRIATSLGGQRFNKLAIDAVKTMKPALDTDRMQRFWTYYQSTMVPTRGLRYLSLLNGFFTGYSEVSQVLFRIKSGQDLGEDEVVSSADFEKVRMLYGNAFEVLGDVVDILALLNNVLQGREYDEFAQLALPAFYKLDKISRFNPYSSTPSFAAMSAEADNNLRNASHHGGMFFDMARSVIVFRAGKGGQGPAQEISYAMYLQRSVKIVLQTTSIFCMELLLGSQLGIRPPI